MKALKAIKKIMAVTVTAAFAVATTVGAGLATDLGDYPAPFATGEQYNGKIIVGEQASAIDIVGSVNVAASFTDVGGAGSVVVETPEGKVVDAVAFDQKDGNGDDLDDDEMPMKGETRSLDFDEDDTEWSFMQGYDDDDITETLEINFTADDGSSECDPDEVINIDSFVYTFVDERDELGDEIDDVEDDDDFSGDGAKFEYDVTLFGKQYKLIDDDVEDDGDGDLETAELDGLKLQLAYADHTVQKGDVIDLAPYGYDGYELQIVRITEESSGAGADDGSVKVALVKDGVTVDDEVMDEPDQGDETTEKLKDDDEDVEVEVVLTDVSFDATTSEYFAEIRFETGILEEDDYFDDNEKWQLTKLEVDPADEKLTIEVTYTNPDDDIDCELEGSDLYMGNTLSLQGYLELGFIGLSQPSKGDVDFKVAENTDGDLELTITADDNVYIETDSYKDKGAKATFVLDTDTDTWNLTKFTGEDNDEVEESGDLLDDVIIYIDDDNEYALEYDEANDELEITEPTDLDTNTIVIGNLTADDWADNVYDSNGVLKDISGEDTTDIGTVLLEYSANARSADFEFVSDAVRYQVYAGQKVQSEGNEVTLSVGDNTVTGTIKSVGAKPLPVGLAILDSELTSPDAVKNDNYIVVGGPCANSAAAALMGVTQENCAEDFTPGEALIKLYENDENYQLLVAGYDGADTLLATKVLASYKDFLSDFDGKTEVVVKGTSLADVEIEG